jgi:ABC-2 type transport system permease protein
LYKEVLRFWKVSFQTVAAPVLNALLFLLIFSHVLDRPRGTVYGRRLHQLPGAGPGDDVGAAERLRQQLVLADPVARSPATSSSCCCRRCRYREFYAAYVLAATLRAG